nr:GntR family transcriptional regulator [Brevundimonas diminuta]
MRSRDPFGQALAALRQSLAQGLAPGERLAIADVAAALKLSTSPVREALSRLCGEGLIDDRRGLGYFVRALPAEDIVGLLQLERGHIELALSLADQPPPGPAELERFVEWSIALMARCDSEPLKESFDRVSARLAPVRQLEHRLQKDLAIGPDGEGNTLAQYYEARMRLARSLASAMRRLPTVPGEYLINTV